MVNSVVFITTGIACFAIAAGFIYVLFFSRIAPLRLESLGQALPTAVFAIGILLLGVTMHLFVFGLITMLFEIT